MKEINKDIVKEAVAHNEFNLKEMLARTKNVISHYAVERASANLIIRKVGYAGFCVVYMYNKVDGKWSVEGHPATPDHIVGLIERQGVQLETDVEFYKASHAYSTQVYGQ